MATDWKIDDLIDNADIYAFGVMLYQMITGRLPFVGTWEQLELLHKTQPAPVDNVQHPALTVIRKARRQLPLVISNCVV